MSLQQLNQIESTQYKSDCLSRFIPFQSEKFDFYHHHRHFIRHHQFFTIDFSLRKEGRNFRLSSFVRHRGGKTKIVKLNC